MNNKMFEEKRVYNDIPGLEANSKHAYFDGFLDNFKWRKQFMWYGSKEVFSSMFVKGMVSVLELIRNSNEQYRVVENDTHAY